MAITIAAFSLPLLTHAWLPGSIAWATRSTRRWVAVAAASTARFVRLTRPHNDVAAGIAVVVGAHVGGRAELATEPVLRAAIVAALVVAAANVANDLADVAEDRVNRPTRPIAAGRVSTAAAARFAAALAILALGLAIPLGSAAVACVALLSAIAAAYSGYVPGVPALKGMGIIGNLVVAGLSGSTIVFGALVLADPAPAVAVATLAIATSVLSSEVLKATADREGDHAAGRRTLATTTSVATCLRVHRVLVVALVVLVLAAPLAGVVRPSFLLAAIVGVIDPPGSGRGSHPADGPGGRRPSGPAAHEGGLVQRARRALVPGVRRRTMSGRTYRDVQIIADGATVDIDGIRRLSVRAQAPRAGSTSPETTELSAEGARSLAALVGRLEQWALPEAEVILLGAALADLLLPSGARQLLAESLASLAEDEGLRLRLTLDPALSEYPWEALWVARQQGLKDATGFLALDPRVSIVRDLPVQAPLPDGAPAVGDRRVLAALSVIPYPGTCPAAARRRTPEPRRGLRRRPGHDGRRPAATDG